jgi:hypothetical protein
VTLLPRVNVTLNVTLKTSAQPQVNQGRSEKGSVIWEAAIQLPATMLDTGRTLV